MVSARLNRPVLVSLTWGWTQSCKLMGYSSTSRSGFMCIRNFHTTTFLWDNIQSYYYTIISLYSQASLIPFLTHDMHNTITTTRTQWHTCWLAGTLHSARTTCTNSPKEVWVARHSHHVPWDSLWAHHLQELLWREEDTLLSGYYHTCQSTHISKVLCCPQVLDCMWLHQHWADLKSQFPHELSIVRTTCFLPDTWEEEIRDHTTNGEEEGGKSKKARGQTGRERWWKTLTRNTGQGMGRKV